MADQTLGLQKVMAKPSRKLLFWHEFARGLQVFMEMVWVSLWLRALLYERVQLPYWKLYLVLGITGLAGYGLALVLKNKYGDARWIPPLYILFCLAAGYAVICLLLYTGEWPSPWGMASSMGLVLSSHFDIPPHIWIFLVTLGVIWRCLLLARHTIGVLSLRDSFQFGLGALLFYGLFDLNQAIPPAHLQFGLYFLLALVTLGTTRLVEMSLEVGRVQANLRPLWLGLILGFAILWIACTAGLDRLIFLQQDLIREGAVYLVAVILMVTVFPLTIIAMGLVDLFIEVIRFLMNLFRDVFSGMRIDINAASPNVQQVPLLNHTINTRPWIVIVLALALLAAIYISFRLVKGRRNWNAVDGMESDLESVDWLDRQRNWFKRNLSQISALFNRRLNLADARKLWAAARIRYIYSRMLALSSRLGEPRPAFATPSEFCPKLQKRLPDAAEDIALITAAYNRIRYGELPETGEEVERVLAAWQKITRASRPGVNSK